MPADLATRLNAHPAFIADEPYRRLVHGHHGPVTLADSEGPMLLGSLRRRLVAQACAHPEGARVRVPAPGQDWQGDGADYIGRNVAEACAKALLVVLGPVALGDA